MIRLEMRLTAPGWTILGGLIAAIGLLTRTIAALTGRLPALAECGLRRWPRGGRSVGK